MRIEKWACLGLLIFLSASCKEGATVPNIIFIMADDHAVQAISAYGHPLSQLAPTPNIDRIAQNGALFTQSFCTNSICGPSRAVILTGKHSHLNGFRKNGDHFDGSQPTLPKFLAAQGYRTAVIGKWHLHGEPQGFDHWNILNDQGNYYNPEFIRAGDTSTVIGYATDLITDFALDWIKTETTTDQPFFLMLHHKAPHRNWMPALRHMNRYDSISFPLPDSYFDEHQGQRAAQEQQQTIYKDMYEGHDLKMTAAFGHPELAHNPWANDFDRMTPEQRAQWDAAYSTKNNVFHESHLTGRALAEWKAQRYLQEYLGTLAAVDEGVGRLLDYLEASGLDQNTLVVYTSDQGFYLGEKGFFDKRFMYEESLRMPLLMQWPERIQRGITIDAMVQNLDFAPTFLDLAHATDTAGTMQGKSFLHLFDQGGRVTNDSEVIYYHYYDYPAFHMVKKHYGIRTNRYKLIHFYDDIDAWEFYDLENDPQEEYNAIDDAHYTTVIQEMHRTLDSVQRHYQVTGDEFKKASSEQITKAYKDFERLRGTPMQ